MPAAPARRAAAPVASRSPEVLDGPETHVVGGRRRVAHEVLEDDGDAALPGGGVNCRQIDPVDGDTTARRVVQAGQQLHQGRLPRAVQPNYRRRATGGDDEIEVGEDLGRGTRIAKGDRLEAHLALGQPRRQRHRLGPGRPPPTRSRRVSKDSRFGSAVSCHSRATSFQLMSPTSAEATSMGSKIASVVRLIVWW